MNKEDSHEILSSPKCVESRDLFNLLQVGF